jgi:hypothetical protein
VTIEGQNAWVWAIGTFDLTGSPSAAFWLIRGSLWVDSVAQTGEVLKYISRNDRVTLSRVWPLTLAAGTHTIKLRVVKDAGAGTASYAMTYTQLALLVVDIP